MLESNIVVEKDIFSSLEERTSKDPMIISPLYNYKYKLMLTSVVKRTSKDPMMISPLYNYKYGACKVRSCGTGGSMIPCIHVLLQPIFAAIFI